MMCLLLSKGLLSDAGGLHRPRKGSAANHETIFQKRRLHRTRQQRHRREDKNAF